MSSPGDQVSSTARPAQQLRVRKKCKRSGRLRRKCTMVLALLVCQARGPDRRRDRTYRISTGSESRHVVRPIQDRFGEIVERAATLQSGAVRALRRLKLFRMFREDHRHTPSATSRPPGERNKKIPSRVGHFRNGGVLSESKDTPTARSSRAESGR